MVKISLINNDFNNIIKKHHHRFVNSIISKLEKNEKLKEWINKLKQYKLEDIYKKYNSSRIKWLPKEETILFKFNRMGHAMDPERGMIWYYRYRHNKPIISRIIFPSTGDKVFKNKKLRDDYDYLKAFELGTGLEKGGKFTDFLKKKNYLKGLRLIQQDLNITEFLDQNFYFLNKQLTAIFYNSNKLLIQDKREINRVILSWENKFDLFNIETNLKVIFTKERDFIKEDDVTYIIAHQVLEKNGFKIISLSYPGAQGDRAILPQPGAGRKQQRKYIDIVACYPEKYLDLMENKGSFHLSEVTLDIEKLNKYRSDNNFKHALDNLVEKVSPKNKGLPILLSVSFWISNKNTNLKGLPINEINFFVTISPDIKRWKIWTGGDLNVFKYKEGEINLEKTYCVI